ncbi:MAG: DUF4388 domain-containing protein [Candidatus Dormibacteria bacterium]
MQTQGSLAEAPLASLLQAMQSERATGTLSVENGENDCALYFLFGHLFHASGPQGQGEDVVVDALSWGQGTFRFDPRAKLPAEETIKASPADLIAEAQQRQPAGMEQQWNGTATGAGVDSSAEPQSDHATGAPADSAGGHELGGGPDPGSGHDSVGGHESGQDGGEAPELGAAPSYSPAWEPEPAPAYSAWSQPAEAPSPTESTSWASPVDAHPAEEVSPAAAEAHPGSSDSYQPPPFADGSSAASANSQSAGEDPYGRRATDAPPLAELYPLPSGKAVYEGLKSAFVDFPKLLRTLRTDTHTGYVRLAGDQFTGVLIFHDGHLLEALAKTQTARQGEPAFKDVQTRMERGEGVLDVIDLPGDTVVALAQLLMARPMFTGLMGRFINFASLIEYLSEEQVDGSVIVATDEDTGVILLRRGEVLGAYTQAQAKLDQKTDGVQKLATERSARIEVKGGMGDISGIDVEAALNRSS